MPATRPAIATLLTILVSVSTSAQEVDLQKLKTRMRGEDVLSAQNASLLNPICRLEDHPWFEVSNVRPGDSLSVALVFDFVCDSATKYQINAVVVARGNRYRFPISSLQTAKRQGTVRCSYYKMQDKSALPADLEVYIELTDSDPKTSRYDSGGKNPLYFKVSKSAVRGNVTQVSNARQMRTNEWTIYAERLKKYGPPPPAPTGYQTAKSHWPIVPGTPVLAAYQGDWMKGEVLGTQKGKLLVDVPDLKDTVQKYTYGFFDFDAIALSKRTIQLLAKSPETFSPSVLLAEGSYRRIPSGHVILPNAELPKGITLRDPDWGDMFVLEDLGENLNVFSRKYSKTYTKDRNAMYISREMLRKVENNEISSAMASAVDEMIASSVKTKRASRISRAASDAKIRDYEISIPIPKGYRPVTMESNIEVGDLVLISYSGKWEEVKVLSLREEDKAIEIEWNTWSASYYVSRPSLVTNKPETNIASSNSNKIAAAPDSAPNRKATSTSTSDSEYSIYLDKATVDVDTAKLIIEIADVDLPMAIDILKALPIRIKKGLTKSEADKMKSRFEALGASVSIKS